MTDKKIFLNKFLVEAFNEILRIEEYSLNQSEFNDLTVKEMHVIEAVAICTKTNSNTSLQIAEYLGIVPGTLSVSVNSISRKGYLQRVKSEQDKRVVYLELTEKGKQANAIHSLFHSKMVEYVLDVLTPEEASVFCKGLGSVAAFFKSQQTGHERNK